MISVRVTAGLKRVAKARMLVGATLRSVRSVKMLTADGLKQVAVFTPAFAPMSVAPVPAYANGTGTNRKPVIVRSNTVTATVTGGVGPYTYAWTMLEPGPTINTPTMAATSFEIGVGPGGEETGTARCIVTDSIGTQASCDVPITLTNNY